MARSLIEADVVFPVREVDLEVALPLDAAVTYHLRPITVERGRAIVAKNTRKVPDPASRRRVEETNFAAIHDDMLDYALVRWEGITNGSTPAPCDLVHKKLLPGAIQSALIDRASAGQADAPAESFRPPA